MKRTVLFILLLSCFSGICLFAEENLSVERLMRTGDVRYVSAHPYPYPSALRVDEAALSIVLPGRGGAVRIYYQETEPSWTAERWTDDIVRGMGGQYIDLADWSIRAMPGFISSYNIKSGRQYIKAWTDTAKRLAFILKAQPEEGGQNYVVFYTNRDGTAGAFNMVGKQYDPRETIMLLEALDPQMFRRSSERAKELGLLSSFLSGNALIWGRRNYNITDELYSLLGQRAGTSMGIPEYDSDGNSYYLEEQSIKTRANANLFVFDQENNLLVTVNMASYSDIFRENDNIENMTMSLHVGFGGNVYFFYAGEEYTEVFRIRRTWGEPNLYALAVNGYTDDDYGLFVKRTLSEMSAADLALLKDHLYALAGYRFLRPEHQEYFDRQVWYVPCDIRQEDITLIDLRRALLELIQREEEGR
jgi:hypothetical protein